MWGTRFLHAYPFCSRKLSAVFGLDVEDIGCPMRLPKPTLGIETKLREFDVWITPSLEIRDTDQFKVESDAVAETFEAHG